MYVPLLAGGGIGLIFCWRDFIVLFCFFLHSIQLIFANENLENKFILSNFWGQLWIITIKHQTCFSDLLFLLPPLPLQAWCGSWPTARTASSSPSPPAGSTLSTTSGRFQPRLRHKIEKRRRKIKSALFDFLFIVLLTAAAHSTCQCLGAITSGEFSI